MANLLFWLLEVFSPMLPSRLAYVLSGVGAIAGGALLFRSGLGLPFLVLGVLLIAGGVGFIALAKVLPVPRDVTVREPEATPPPDDWKPPSAEDVKKTLEGR